MFLKQFLQLHRQWMLVLFLLILSVSSMMAALFWGSVSLPFSEVIRLLSSHTKSIDHLIIWQIRLPRAGCAFLVGGMLALSGALMQALLRNPLADPYVLGISGGAAVASLIAMLSGLSGFFFHAWILSGAFLSIVLVIGLSRLHAGWSSIRLLLTGVVVATGWAACITFILTISPNEHLKSMLFWLMGDLSYAHFSIWILVVLLIALLIAFRFSRALDLLVRGEPLAKTLGVNTVAIQWILLLVSALLTAVSVDLAGCVGFIGLIVPHMLRLMGILEHRFLFPASVLLGGSLLTLADTLARTMIAPTQLPVGVITAFLGVPLFLLLLQRGYRF